MVCEKICQIFVDASIAIWLETFRIIAGITWHVVNIPHIPPRFRGANGGIQWLLCMGIYSSFSPPSFHNRLTLSHAKNPLKKRDPRLKATHSKLKHEMLWQAPIQLHPTFRVDVEISCWFFWDIFLLHPMYLTQAKLETTSPKNFQPNLLPLMAEVLHQ